MDSRDGAIRPRTLVEMQLRMSGFMTDESMQRGLAYSPDSSDVFISPYAKCGTTWMQQIVHGLRSGGSMDFDEITQVTPWLELAFDMGVHLDAPQVASPRVFKSHLGWHEIPKGGRYIVVFRDPIDAMVSLYRFLDGWFFEDGAISLSEFAEYYLSRDELESYWGHTKSWWAQRNRPEVLLLCFEQMKRDLPGTVERVADFLDVSISPQDRAVAAAQASFEFMKRHERQFDDHLVRQARDAACGLPSGGRASKVAKGRAGDGRFAVSDHVRQRFSKRWRDTMGQFGLRSYEDLLQQIAQSGT